MGYNGEISNPLGTDNFLQLFDKSDIDDTCQIINDIYNKLIDELKEDSIKKFAKYNNSHKLITVSVDGGNQEIFRNFKEISSSIIIVNSKSDDLKETIKPFRLALQYKNFFPKLYSFLNKNNQEKIDQNIDIKEESENIFKNDYIRNFMEKTEITSKDIGSASFLNLQTFTSIIRDIMEWTYIVELVDKYKDIKVIIVKDGRLAQSGVETTFIDKLKKYFSKNNAYVVGLLKRNAVFDDGLASMIILSWIETINESFYFKVPHGIMDYVYSNKRQWDHSVDNSKVFGIRYFGRLYGKCFSPFQSMIALDIPYYLDSKDKEIHDIIGTIFSHKSVLYDGSISVVSESHIKSSIAYSVVKQIENELLNKIDSKIIKNTIKYIIK